MEDQEVLAMARSFVARRRGGGGGPKGRLRAALARGQLRGTPGAVDARDVEVTELSAAVAAAASSSSSSSEEEEEELLRATAAVVLDLRLRALEDAWRTVRVPASVAPEAREECELFRAHAAIVDGAARFRHDLACGRPVDALANLREAAAANRWGLDAKPPARGRGFATDGISRHRRLAAELGAKSRAAVSSFVPLLEAEKGTVAAILQEVSHLESPEVEAIRDALYAKISDRRLREALENASVRDDGIATLEVVGDASAAIEVAETLGPADPLLLHGAYLFENIKLVAPRGAPPLRDLVGFAAAVDAATYVDCIAHCVAPCEQYLARRALTDALITNLDARDYDRLADVLRRVSAMPSQAPLLAALLRTSRAALLCRHGLSRNPLVRRRQVDAINDLLENRRIFANNEDDQVDPASKPTLETVLDVLQRATTDLRCLVHSNHPVS